MLTSGTLNFGSVLVGQTVTQTLTITETGNADLDVSAFVVTDPTFIVTSAPALPATIVDGSGGSVILTISCTPLSTGLVFAILSVSHNAPGGIADYTLTCTGIVPKATTSGPLIRFSPVSQVLTRRSARLAFCNRGS